MPEEPETCSNCRFLINNTCRVQPPNVIFTNGGILSLWPEVKPLQWCGVWEKKEPE